MIRPQSVLMSPRKSGWALLVWCALLNFIACGPREASSLDASQPADAGTATSGDAKARWDAGEEPSSRDGGRDPGLEEDAGTLDAGSVSSRCEAEDDWIRCDHQSTTILAGLSGLLPRDVHWQIPVGEAPAEGWPVAILYQGSLAAAPLFWYGVRDGPGGMYHQTRVVRALLDAGYAVVTPEAHLEGFTAWETNVPPMSLEWEISSDHRFVLAILEAIEQGRFGPLDHRALFAAGISSGGYMSSRMAISYEGRFLAIAVQSASYATCGGPLCSVPALSARHVPTLLLHGEEDRIVPIDTMWSYVDRLLEAGIEHRVVVDSDAAHEWISAAPDAIVDWFEQARMSR